MNAAISTGRTADMARILGSQIIRNVTANAYKDEDSGIEDSLKSTLSIIKDRMIAIFLEVESAASTGRTADMAGVMDPRSSGT